MSKSFPHLFEPLLLRHKTLKHRLNFGAHTVVIATGSLPDSSGFQRFGPTPGHIDGIGNANVWPVDDVMSRACRPGKRVLLLDDGGNWRGCGTAWHLAEQGHEVTLLTPEGMPVHSVGDCVAPRWAVHAIYEGRKLGLSF
ncbi:MAG: hypothetical protein QNL90_03450 [Gammaproteobacteria bacterium]|nr:hypothetical protein [Gammaproteobacteria bacterium]MDX2459155.1 hypothetical protein [Gammaproteobacteria bacterium]